MSKSRVAVIVDSTAYIPDNLVQLYNIKVIPQIINWEGESLLDDIDIKPPAFYQRLQDAKELPTTSQPSAGEFHKFFMEVAEEADSIVSLHLSEHLSGTVASAHAAASMMPDFPIEIIDSRSVSMGLGFMALEAARIAEKGHDYVESAKAARALKPKMRILFIVDTLEFLHRSGRIGGAKRLFGSILSIKPLLHFENGRIEPLVSVRTKRKAIARAINILAQDVANSEKVRCCVVHANTHQDAVSLFGTIEREVKPAELLLAELSPAVGVHTGPGTLAIVYYVESE